METVLITIAETFGPFLLEFIVATVGALFLRQTSPVMKEVKERIGAERTQTLSDQLGEAIKP